MLPPAHSLSQILSSDTSEMQEFQRALMTEAFRVERELHELEAERLMETESLKDTGHELEMLRAQMAVRRGRSNERETKDEPLATKAQISCQCV